MTDVQLTTPLGSERRRRDWRSPLAVLALVICTLVVYGRVCGHEFAGWDDQLTIHHNPRYSPPTGAKIAQTWKESVNGLYAPVTYSYWGALAFMAELKDVDPLGVHLDARVFHTGSLILHLASVLVVFSILKLLSENVWASLGGAMLYSLHPVQVESVAWASGAKDLLCGLLSLCAIYQYLLFARAEVAGRRRWSHYVCGGLALLLAMLSKPSAMVVPVLVATLDLLVVRRGWRKVATASGGWALLVLPLAVVARLVQTVYAVAPVAWWRRPAVAADSVIFYVGKLVWPVALSADYARRPAVALQVWGGLWPVLAVLIAAGLGVWIWRRRAARPWVAAGAVIFVAALGPVLGLTPFMFQYTSTVADHYLYLAMFGPAMLATWALVRFRGRAVAGGCAVAFALLGVRSYGQLSHWHDDSAVWVHSMEVCPGSFVAPTNLAACLGREANVFRHGAEDAREAGRMEEAEWMLGRARENYARAADLLDKGLAINPDFMAARHNAFMYNFRLGRNQQAVEHLEALLAVNEQLPAVVRTDFTSYRETAGILWMKLGQYEKAAAQFERVVAAVPENTAARDGLREARSKSAEARLESGEIGKP
ncbi:MAG: Tetratricopeptide 2 repeat protein [Phycisphaerales bacterium]|nr:Tetratricopeptide 2 repeat protein [Phycisphaerales bacterium]